MTRLPPPIHNFRTYLLKMSKNLFFTLIITSAIGLVACSQQEQSETETVNQMELIKKSGVYKLVDVQLTLRVFKDSQGRIDYTITDGSGGVLVQAKRKFNPMHRWGMVIDGKQRLWVHSSDVGMVLWEKCDTGAYSDKNVTQEDANEMPKPLFDMLPRVLKKKWASSRPQPELERGQSQ